MNQYLELIKTTVKAQFAYRANVIIGVLMSIIKIYLAYILWGVLFEGKNEIAGFTFDMMVTYYILVNFFQKLNTTDGLVIQFSSEIKDGQFSKYLIKPTNPIWNFIAQSLGRTIFIFGIGVLGVLIFGIIFNKYFVISMNLFNVLNALAISFLGILFLTILSYFVTIFSFVIYEVFELNLIKNGILELLTGVMLPLALFPKIVLDVLQYLPIYYINYFPTMLLMNKLTNKIGMAYFVLIIWNLAMFMLAKGVYNRFIRRFEGVGI